MSWSRCASIHRCRRTTRSRPTSLVDCTPAASRTRSAIQPATAPSNPSRSPYGPYEPPLCTAACSCASKASNSARRPAVIRIGAERVSQRKGYRRRPVQRSRAQQSRFDAHDEVLGAVARTRVLVVWSTQHRTVRLQRVRLRPNDIFSPGCSEEQGRVGRLRPRSVWCNHRSERRTMTRPPATALIR